MRPRTVLKLTVQYDGTRFCGWQNQPEGCGVQDALEKAFLSLLNEAVTVHGSGRTDAGVHATGQTATIDRIAERFTPEAWRMALNAHLPQSVRVAKVQAMPEGFHARFSAVGKTYEYRIWNDRVMHPLEHQRAWHHPKPLDPATLLQATQILTGTHDFAAFAANRGYPETDTIRTIHKIRIQPRGALISLQFSGTGFLYRMVRLLTGAIARTASGSESVEWLKSFLQAPLAAKCQYCAPPEGLYLRRVHYPRRQTRK